MYYCNKCGQEILDSGHRCAVPKANASSQLGDGRGAVDFVCPHCKDKEAWASRVQSSDDLSWKTLQPDSTELWECDKCGGYFFLVRKLERIIKLIAEPVA